MARSFALGRVRPRRVLIAVGVAVHGAAILLGDGMLPRDDREAIIDATLDMVSDGLLRAHRPA